MRTLRRARTAIPAHHELPPTRPCDHGKSLTLSRALRGRYNDSLGSSAAWRRRSPSTSVPHHHSVSGRPVSGGGTIRTATGTAIDHYFGASRVKAHFKPHANATRARALSCWPNDTLGSTVNNHSALRRRPTCRWATSHVLLLRVGAAFYPCSQDVKADYVTAWWNVLSWADAQQRYPWPSPIRRSEQPLSSSPRRAPTIPRWSPFLLPGNFFAEVSRLLWIDAAGVTLREPAKLGDLRRRTAVSVARHPLVSADGTPARRARRLPLDAIRDCRSAITSQRPFLQDHHRSSVIHAPEIGRSGHVHSLSSTISRWALPGTALPLNPVVPWRPPCRTLRVFGGCCPGRLLPMSPFGLTTRSLQHRAQAEALVAELSRQSAARTRVIAAWRDPRVQDLVVHRPSRADEPSAPCLQVGRSFVGAQLAPSRAQGREADGGCSIIPARDADQRSRFGLSERRDGSLPRPHRHEDDVAADTWL